MPKNLIQKVGPTTPPAGILEIQNGIITVSYMGHVLLNYYHTDHCTITTYNTIHCDSQIVKAGGRARLEMHMMQCPSGSYFSFCHLKQELPTFE